MSIKRTLLAIFILSAIALGFFGAKTLGKPRLVILPDATSLAENPDVKGYIDSAKIVGGGVIIKGWAVNTNLLKPAQRVILYINGRRISEISPTEIRPELPRVMVSKGVEKAGFSMTFPQSHLGALPGAAEVRLFAVHDSGTKELDYPTGYPFLKSRDLASRMEIYGAEVSAIRQQMSQMQSLLGDLYETMPVRSATEPHDPATTISRRRIYLTARDDYQVLDRGQGSFNDTSGKQELPCSEIPSGKRTAVLLIFGQSNSTNQGQGRFNPDTGVYNFNFFDGKCYVAKDPLLGTSGTKGSFASRLGDRLIKAKVFDAVVLVPISVGGTYMEDWTLGGVHFRRIPVAIKRLAQKRLRITHLLWHQGEGNVQHMANPEAYKANFLDMLNAIRSYAVNAPVFVPLTSVCGSAPYEKTRRGQRALVDPARGIYPGPDTDGLGFNYRYDNCHFGSAGLDAHAEMWFRTLKHHQNAPPGDPGIRVTAKIIGAKPAPAPAPAKVVPPGVEVKAEYLGYGSTDRVISLEKGKATAADGDSALGPKITVMNDTSQLRVHILMRGQVTENNSFVVAGFREGETSPDFLVSRKGSPGEDLIIDENLTIPAKIAGTISFDVRVGLAKPGGRLFVNGGPEKKGSWATPSHIAIKEK